MSERRLTITVVSILLFFSISTRTPAAETPDRLEDWVKRLKGLEGHKAAASRVGPELVKLKPDFGLKVVEAAWPDLTDIEVKRGLLKAFHFARHPKIIKALHLGVTDSEKKVRETALNYLSEYSLQKFTGNTKAYRHWYAEFSDQSLEEIREAGLKRNRPILKKKLQEIVRISKTGNRRQLWDTAREVAKFKDPFAIPTLIGIIDADNSYDTIYGVGYFGLGRITKVRYNKEHNGAWWRQWWEKNKGQYPKHIREMEIPNLGKKEGHGPPSIELPSKELPPLSADIADIASKELHAEGDLNKRYFLIGAGKDDKPPKEGYSLIVIMPGGGGGENFHPFVRRIYKNALGDKFLVAQPVAFKWHGAQRIVWPTKVNPTRNQKFATEDFIEAVIQDVKKQHKINKRNIFTLSWSSSGPAAYAISLQKSTQVKGSFIAMSVFRRNWLPPLDTAKGHIYYLLHSPDDKICPFSHAEQAKAELTEAGAIVQLDTYKGGHGWHGGVYSNIQRGITWLTAKMNQEKPPSKQ
jgi:predicted esterase